MGSCDEGCQKLAELLGLDEKLKVLIEEESTTLKLDHERTEFNTTANVTSSISIDANTADSATIPTNTAVIPSPEVALEISTELTAKIDINEKNTTTTADDK